MKIWAISDPHLSFSVPEKNMTVFGPLWDQYIDKMEIHWRRLVSNEDLVLIPGDISWAMRLEDALVDLNWIDNLPGIKVILKGNHDYWWSSNAKMAKVMPPSIYFLSKNALTFDGIAIGGARLWDSQEYRFDTVIAYQENPRIKDTVHDANADEKIFLRELERLKLSLSGMDQNTKLKIAMTHYPPIGLDLKPSRASVILEEYNIDICVFGHLHSLKKTGPLFGEARGVKYILASCDYLDFQPFLLN
jgi:hypothetical protein